MTRIVFMGTPEFAVPSLDILLAHRYEIPAVVTAPDKPRGRGRELSPTPVKECASAAGLPVLQPPDLKDPAFAGQIRALAPDIIVVVAFRILPGDVFRSARLGAFNLHASLLPKYRGAAPINWAIINGEQETGVTTFFLAEKVDTGGMILQSRISIGADDDAGTVHDRLSLAGADAVLETVRRIEQGTAVVIPQDDAAASKAPKIFKDDCRINWNRPVLDVRNFIRGLAPYPAAFTLHEGKVLKIYKTAVERASSGLAPGTVRATPTQLLVGTADGTLSIMELQQEGRRRMTVEEFLRGYKLVSGDTLGD